MFGTSLSLL